MQSNSASESYTVVKCDTRICTYKNNREESSAVVSKCYFKYDFSHALTRDQSANHNFALETCKQSICAFTKAEKAQAQAQCLKHLQALETKCL